MKIYSKLLLLSNVLKDCTNSERIRWLVTIQHFNFYFFFVFPKRSKKQHRDNLWKYISSINMALWGGICHRNCILFAVFEVQGLKTVKSGQVIKGMWWEISWVVISRSLLPFLCVLGDCGELGVPSAQGCCSDCSALKPCWHRASYRSQGLTP